MPTWGEILKELQEESKNNQAPFDQVRRKYLTQLFSLTKRNTILYASAWTQAGKQVVSPEALSIIDEDIQGLMEVVHGLKGKSLDLIIHSPGGSLEAAEAFVTYLRTKFHDIRVIIPQAAMSAATMISCSANTIMMGKHSSIGPIDPQFVLQTQLGKQMVPAQAIIDQFDLAKKESQDPKKLGAWMPILGQYGPALIVQCDNALELSKQLVKSWLFQYMFGKKSQAKAECISEYLANHKNFKTHGRHIDRAQAKKIGLRIENMEKNQKLQDAILSVFHATTHTLSGTGSVKIIENHLGKAFVKMQQKVVIQQPPTQNQLAIQEPKAQSDLPDL